MSETNKYSTVITYKKSLRKLFSQPVIKSKRKLFWTFLFVKEVKQVPETFLKHLEDTDRLYEMRAQLSNDICKIFRFFDECKLVVLANGYEKKTRKIPIYKITKALKTM